MNQEITAIYENGMFRPLQSVTLDDHVTVTLTVRPSSEKSNATTPSTDIEFESQLEGLLFDGPSPSRRFLSRGYLLGSRLMQYLVDTGVLLRLFDRTDPSHICIFITK
jgi:predicted DNA-binding antitoxin AbrB/MazE fold protein